MGGVALDEHFFVVRKIVGFVFKSHILKKMCLVLQKICNVWFDWFFSNSQVLNSFCVKIKLFWDLEILSFSKFFMLEFWQTTLVCQLLFVVLSRTDICFVVSRCFGVWLLISPESTLKQGLAVKSSTLIVEGCVCVWTNEVSCALLELKRLEFVQVVVSQLALFLWKYPLTALLFLFLKHFSSKIRFC